MSEFFYPKLQSVSALEPYRLITTWSTGEVLEVDVSNVMHGPAFAEIRKPEVFRNVPQNSEPTPMRTRSIVLPGETR